MFAKQKNSLKPFCNLRWKALALISVAILLASCGDSRNGLTIAAVGPLTGAAAARGKDLERAVRMAVDEANAAGGVNGKKVLVDVYDDGDQPARARELALKIASTTPALAVLGQVASQAAVAAGQVYKEQGIVAVTGAASEARVTRDNPWFFRLFRDASGQGRFLADYVRYRFGARQIAVIRDVGTAGDEFASALRDRAKSDGIRISADLEFTPKEAHDHARLDEIAQKLSSLPKGQIIVLGTQYGDTPDLLRVLRDKLGSFPSLGYSSLATDNLSKQFAEAESARHTPGYYTDGFTVAAPQLPDVAEYTQMAFASRYKARYDADPSPEGVRWYEGARMILQAARATGVGGANRAEDRRRIRDWIAARKRADSAAEGVGGPFILTTITMSSAGSRSERFTRGD